jgi:hypothetical protein
MKMTALKSAAALISFAAGAAAFSGAAAAQCERHFYNDSPIQYTTAFTTGNGLCNNFVVCTIPPHTTATLIYFPYPAGHTVIGSSYATHQLGVTGCYIDHSGSTGDIAVNDPADGDVTTCGSNWECPKPTSIPAPRGQRK